jgi:hypothetical protein
VTRWKPPLVLLSRLASRDDLNQFTSFEMSLTPSKPKSSWSCFHERPSRPSS